jgi:hypothetical protein
MFARGSQGRLKMGNRTACLQQYTQVFDCHRRGFYSFRNQGFTHFQRDLACAKT